MNGISVIICCHNSAGRIAETLKHLWIQETTGFDMEIILVDNNCVDDTTEIAEREWILSGQSVPFRIIVESNTGLSIARIRGVRSAKFNYAVFCDDDNWLCSKFLKRAFDVMVGDSTIGVLGGSSTACSDVDFPAWFQLVKENYAVGLQSEGVAGDVSSRGYLWGAGMVFRKGVLEEMIERGITSVLSDRKGKELSSGGDSEICKWFLLLGYSLWYDPSLNFIHFLESDRLTEGYYSKMLEKQEEAYNSLLIYDSFLEFSKFSFFERKRLYLKGIVKSLLKIQISSIEEKAISFLLKRDTWNNSIHLKIVRNIQLLLGMK